MPKPSILAVDDDPGVARAIVRDLRVRYGSDYRVIRATSGAEALRMIDDLALRDRPVALVVSDQRMPEMTGIEMLEQVRHRSPDTKLLLLTAYADTDVAIRAINDIGLDYYMFKPWDPPQERLYPVVDDLLSDWTQEHPEVTSEVRVVGHLWSDHTYEIKMFLTRNHVPYRWLDIERDDEARKLLGLAQVGPQDLPLVLRRQRTRGTGGRRLRGVRRTENRGGRARRPRRSGRAECVDRELPRVPQGPLRCRPHPPCGGSGRAVRRRDRPGPRRGGGGGPGAGARRPARRSG